MARTVIGYFWERRDFFVLLHRHETKLDPDERAWIQGVGDLVYSGGSVRSNMGERF